jgi:ArsR family transcriptional regulator
VAKLPACKVTIIHEDRVARVGAEIPKDERLFDLADFFKVLGDTTRVKILQSLRRAELCVCDLAAVLGMSQSAVSHQLKILRMANIVKHHRSGKTVYYSLSDEHVSSLLDLGLEHVEEDR